mgnify:CR=1 FL=1
MPYLLQSQWWITSIVTGGMLLAVYLLITSIRLGSAARLTGKGQVRSTWKLRPDEWRQYLRGKSGGFLSQVVAWLAFYALAMTLVARTGGFWISFLQFLLFSVVILLPGLTVIILINLRFPARYTMTSEGVGMEGWMLFNMRPGFGMVDTGYRPWSRVEAFRWEGKMLLLQGKRALFSSGAYELPVPDDQRKAVEAVLKERGLKKDPNVARPQRRTIRTRRKASR